MAIYRRRLLLKGTHMGKAAVFILGICIGVVATLLGTFSSSSINDYKGGPPRVTVTVTPTTVTTTTTTPPAQPATSAPGTVVIPGPATDNPPVTITVPPFG